MELASWICAIATLGALIAAVAAALIAKRLYVMERERDRRLSAEKLRREPSQVSCWTVSVYADVTYDKATRRDGLVLSNGATTPVFTVEIASNNRLGISEPPVRLHVVPPGEYFIERDLKTNYLWKFPQSTDYLKSEVVVPVMKQPKWVVTCITFNDASGTRWTRDVFGALSRLDG